MTRCEDCGTEIEHTRDGELLCGDCYEAANMRELNAAGIDPDEEAWHEAGDHAYHDRKENPDD